MLLLIKSLILYLVTKKICTLKLSTNKKMEELLSYSYPNL